MGASVVFKENTTNYDRIVSINNKLQGLMIKVGFIEGEKVASPEFTGSKHKPITNMNQLVIVAVTNEKGSVSRKIPARPFLVPAIDGNVEAINKIKDMMLDNVYSGSITINTGLRAIGEEAVGLVQKKIDEVTSPRLSQRTIDRKGSDKPLIDRGQMKNSVSHKVVSSDK